MNEIPETQLVIDEKTLPIIESICDGMPGGFFIYKADGDGEIIYINKAMLRIFKCDTEQQFRELTGNTFRGLVHPDDYQRICRTIDDQISGISGSKDYVEYRIVCRDGSVRWIEDYGKYTTTEKYGGIFFVFIDDATDRLKTRMKNLERINKELRTVNLREQQYRKAILHNAHTFFEVNLTNDSFISASGQDKDGRIIDMFDFLGLPHFRKYSEYAESVQKRISSESSHKLADFFSIEHLIGCYYNDEPEQVFECNVFDTSGRERVFQFVFLIGRNEATGNIVALSVSKDVTEISEKRRLFQIALKEANAANIARHTFLDNISHDIRTPLNGIIGYTELIKNNMNDPESLNRYLENIQISSRQLLKIVNESLELTHIESGKAVLNKSECSLTEITGAVIERIRPDAERKNITLSCDTSGLRDINVCTDSLRLNEAIWQILDNAVKYTDEGGAVSLCAVQTKNSPAGFGHYIFTIKDNGCGIAPEMRESIFDPFRRVENTTMSGVFGSGLGLAVVKNIVDLMNGKIYMESTPEIGSTFTLEITFPLCKHDTAEKPACMDSDDPDFMRGMRILIVEDNPINMEIEQALLETCGCIIGTAENGKEAVEIISGLTSETYDLILMDIQMPVMDGYEAARHIRQLKNPVSANIPIIAVSANAFEDDREKALQSGMNAHFPKPIDINELKTLIRRVISS